MVSLPCNWYSLCLSIPRLFSPPHTSTHVQRTTPSLRPLRPRHPPQHPSASAAADLPPPGQKTRTLFPGGFKRPEIKVPTLVFQLSCDEVLGGGAGDALAAVELAVSRWACIVVVGAGQGGGGRLYEAARLLKSVVGERAYLLVAERVDVATAVGASGVVLSDQGLPAIVARNMMMESKPEAVFLPLVARTVQSANSAFTASNSEGADFLILAMDKDECAEVLVNSLNKKVKVPVFTTIDCIGEGTILASTAKVLQLGASGLVMPLGEMTLLSEDILNQLYAVHNINGMVHSEVQHSHEREIVNLNKGYHVRKGVCESTELDEKERQLVEAEKPVLREAISVIHKAAPQMEEVSLLVDAVSRLDAPFLLVIVVIVC